MQHSVYLQGELGEKFGDKFTVHTENYRDIFKCINVNRPTFLPYLRKCHEEDVGFIVETAGDSIGAEDLFLPLQPGDVTISLAPAGSKKGIGKIIVAIILTYIIIQTGGFGGGGGWAVTAEGVLKWKGLAALSMTASLAMAGIQQIMAPDPAVDKDSPTNYLFSGGANNAIEGDPIPILYGELVVPGRPIAIDIIQGNLNLRKLTTNNVTLSAGNNLSLVKITEEAS